MRFQTYMIDPEAAEMAALRALGGIGDARVLEIGCGDGRLTFRYAPAAGSVLAIDSRDEAIAKAKNTCLRTWPSESGSRLAAPWSSISHRRRAGKPPRQLREGATAGC